MKKLSLVLPLLIMLTPVLAVTCQQSCSSSGFNYYICSGTDYTGNYSCHFTSPLSYCYNSYTEKFGTSCATRCFCYKINDCGCSNLECSGVCSASGCAGTTFSITSVSDLPADTYLNDWSDWNVNIANTGSICAYAYSECHVRSPSGSNYYVTSDSCSVIYSGSTRIAHTQKQVNEVGTWQLLSCSVYEAQGEGVCQTPLVYRDEYDFSPTHTWDVTTSACPPSTFGQCTAGQEGYFQCFANHMGYCEYYSGIGLYCWTNLGDCSPQICSGGSCVSVTTTTTPVSTTTTTVAGTTTTTVESELGEPFDTSDMPSELNFLRNLTFGIFSMSSSIMVGLFLLVFALSIATVIIIIGKRSLR